jgi:hypothetical protein
MAGLFARRALEDAGIAVTDLDGLTGLPEYRNGGLFIDTGLLAFRDPARAARPHSVDSTLVVEWRALTVALLDRVADEVRRKLGCQPETSRWPKCWKAAPGQPAAVSRGRSGPAASRRSRL